MVYGGGAPETCERPSLRSRRKCSRRRRRRRSSRSSTPRSRKATVSPAPASTRPRGPPTRRRSSRSRSRRRRPEILAAIASTYVQEKKPADSVQYLEQALALDPNNETALRLMVAVLAAQGRDEEAKQYLARLPDEQSLDASTQLNLGIMRYNEGKLDEAGAIFDRVLAQHPDRAEAYYFSGLVKLNQEQHAAALERFKKFLELAPQHEKAAEAREFVTHLEQMARQEALTIDHARQGAPGLVPRARRARRPWAIVAAAAPCSRRWRSWSPSCGHASAGHARARRGESRRGWPRRRRTSRRPARPGHRRRRGVSRSASGRGGSPLRRRSGAGEQGEHRRAADHLAVEVERAPLHVDSHVRLGAALTELGEVEDANRALRAALELDPSRRESFLLLGRNLARGSRRTRPSAAGRASRSSTGPRLPTPGTRSGSCIASVGISRPPRRRSAAPWPHPPITAAPSSSSAARCRAWAAKRRRSASGTPCRARVPARPVRAAAPPRGGRRGAARRTWSTSAAICCSSATSMAPIAPSSGRSSAIPSTSPRWSELGQSLLERGRGQEAAASLGARSSSAGGRRALLPRARPASGARLRRRARVVRALPRAAAVDERRSILFFGNVLASKRRARRRRARLPFEPRVPDPRSPRRATSLALVLQARDRPAEARPELERFIALEPRDPAARCSSGVVEHRAATSTPRPRHLRARARPHRSGACPNRRRADAMLADFAHCPEPRGARDVRDAPP